ncbi:unnamed protein product [Closterium sp. Yama58-4]|nr:unnamed protein product [Closterium sp. Yama58-4]
MLSRRLGALFAQAKESTGIVGLDVVPNARQVLIGLYNQTLSAVQVIPQEVVYRQNVEALTRHRLAVCEEEQDAERIEARVQCGQVEELIEQAKDELELIPKMAEWKPWEVPEGHKIEIEETFGDVPSHRDPFGDLDCLDLKSSKITHRALCVFPTSDQIDRASSRSREKDLTYFYPLPVPLSLVAPVMANTQGFDAVMADNGAHVPSVSDLLPDEGQSPQAKKICMGETSSSARPAPVPVMDPAADPEAAPDLTLNGLESSAAPAPVLHGPCRRLRRNRDVVGEVVHNLVRDTHTLVTILFPDNLAEQHRSKIIARVRAGLRPAFFTHSNHVPTFESAPGEVLRLSRRSYARHVFQLPTRDDARGFRKAFPMTYHYNGVSGVRQLLTTSRTPEERKWLFDIRAFHKAYDPYEESSQPQMMGLPIAETDDPFFDNIPAVLWLEDATLPMIINLSCHACDICTSNHRTRDHQWFAATRSRRLANRFTITVAQLQSVNAKLLGQTPVPLAVKADPGVLYIGSEDDVELWTCAICDFECGPAIDSAFEHIRSPGHGLRLMQTETEPTALETLGPMKVHDLRQRQEIASFLASLL